MKFSWLLTFIVFCAVSTGIYFTIQATSPPKIPVVIRIGVLPDEELKSLHNRYKPLLDYLSVTTGLDFRLIPVSDYSELTHSFGNNKLEMTYFGGFTFLQAHLSHNAQPLVMRDVDTRFTSYFLVKGNNLAQSFTDLKGVKFSFGNKLSTSGHLMPRYFMKKNMQITPEKFFTDIRYSGAHDKTAYLVRDGKVDAGVANSEIIKSMLQDGRLKNTDLRIFWETPPYPDYVWAVQNHLPEHLKTQLRDAFLSLDINNNMQKNILKKMGAKSFLPAGISDFHPLMEVAKSINALNLDIK